MCEALKTLEEINRHIKITLCIWIYVYFIFIFLHLYEQLVNEDENSIMKKSYTNFIKLKSSKKHFNSKTIITICLRRATWWSKFDYKAIICEWWWRWWWRLFFLLFYLIKIHIFIYSSSLPLLNEISIMNIWRTKTETKCYSFFSLNFNSIQFHFLNYREI